MAPIIKICGLSTRSSLEAAIAAGADMVGFVFFAPSPRNISLETARALGALARGKAEIVALSVDADDSTLGAIVDALNPDRLQLHGRETPARVAAIGRAFARPTIKAVGVASPADLEAASAYGEVADLMLYDAKAPRDARLPGGNGAAFDWRLLARAPARAYLLSGGLDAANVAQAIALTGAWGVDVSSGVESAPGIKDEDKIAAFARAARAAFAKRRDQVGSLA